MDYLFTGETQDFISEEAILISYYRKMNDTDKEDILLIAKMKAGKRKVVENAKY